MCLKFIVLFVLVYLLSSISHLHGAIFEYNVMDNGAKCDGKTNDSKVRLDMMSFFFSLWFSKLEFLM